MDRISDEKQRQVQRDRERAQREVMIADENKRVYSKVGLGRAFLLIAALLGACAGVTGNAVLSELEGGAAIFARDCGSQVLPGYNDLREAIHTGGAGWVNFVMDAIGCIEPVVMDELRAHHVVAVLFERDVDLLVRELAHFHPSARLKSKSEVMELLVQSDTAIADQFTASTALASDAPAAAALPTGITPGELRRARLSVALERTFFATKVKP